MQGLQIPPIIWNILGSAAVSLVVSIFVFVIGVRIGKERMDRKAMREKYQELFQHFKSLLDSIEGKKLKVWRDYPLVGDSYSPPVRAYLNDGTLNLFPSSISKRMLDLETDTLVASSRISYEAFSKIAPRLEAEVAAALQSEAPQQGTKKIRELSALKLALMNDKEFEDLKIFLNSEPEVYLSLNTSEERGKIRTRYIRSDNLNEMNLSQLLDHLRKVASEEKEEDYASLEGLQKRLNEMQKLLAKRIRDPHPIRETIGSTLSDLFR